MEPLFRSPRLVCLLIPLAIAAQAAPVDFVREVRPIFEKHCYECHAGQKQKSGLRLDIKSEALKGGDNHGPDIVPGKAADSPLIHFLVTDDEDELMPPKGRLSPSEIETLTRWVNEGANWPDGVDTAKLEDKTDHWSFKPVAVSSQPPPSGSLETSNLKLATAQLDAFIDAKLAEKGLRRSPPADAASWLRRVTFDLTGLPPTPEEVAAFLAEAEQPDKEARRPSDKEKESKNLLSPSPPPAVSPSQQARERAVDRLLASPRYGERWAQHWLDVVRYADTHGFEVNTERPNAWPYRDYVIRALNDDTPYDRFIQEQLAGDALGADAATGFLVTASVLLPGQIGKDDASKRLARQDSLDEIVTNIGQTFLGLSIGCARCHDHKFDPISAKDYYAMQAFIAGVEYKERELGTPEAAAARAEIKQIKARLAGLDKQLAGFTPLAKSGAPRPMVNARENKDRFAPVKARRVRFTIHETNNREPCLDELEVFTTTGENIALDAAVTASGENVTADRHELRFVNDGNYGNSRSWMSNEKGKGWVQLEFDREHEIDRVVWSRDRQGKYADRLAIRYVIEAAGASGLWQAVADSDDRQAYDARAQSAPVAFSAQGLGQDEAAEAKRLLAEKRPLEARLKTLEAAQKVFAGSFRAPDAIHLLNRGDPEQPKEPVTPAVPAVFGDLRLPADTPEQQRRRILADWIARADHPLTARVLVNRVWQGHFGAGLVETASDFGRSGAQPTHPELLDWLAAEFIRGGWSLKRLHRLIVLSETYGQASKTIRPSDHQTLSPPPSLSPSLIDSESRYLWRYPSRRLDAESIHDAMLAVSGRLNLAMYGRGYDLFDKRGGLSGFKPVETFTPENQRRLIYAHKVRREREAVFGAFDCPDAGQSTATRRESTTPLQALNLFNSRFTLTHAEAFAERVRAEAGPEPARQVTRAYQLALNRPPSDEELREAEPAVREHGPVVLCRALFNSNEFLFLP